MNGLLNKVVKANTAIGGKVSWIDVAKVMADNGQEGSTEMWRSRWRRQQPRNKGLVADVGIESIQERRSAGENIEVWFEDGELVFQSMPLPPINTRELSELNIGKEETIAIVGDTHIGSKQTAWEALYTFYNIARKNGVTKFFHVGDLTDGLYKMRDNSFYEQDAHGFQEQLNMTIKRYPKFEGCTTFFITGNHDITHMNNGGANIGETVSKLRHDMVYLGHNFGKVWLTPKIDLNLIHPTDGSTSIISYKLQKIMERAKGKRRAKIMCVGHYHKTSFIKMDEMYGLLIPSFQYQTNFMRDKNLDSYVGGYLLHLRFNPEGELLSITPEYVDLDK